VAFVPSWTLCLDVNANHAAKPRNPVTSARLPVALQVRHTVGKIYRMELQAILTDSFNDRGKAFIPSGWGEFPGLYVGLLQR